MIATWLAFECDTLYRDNEAYTNLMMINIQWCIQQDRRSPRDQQSSQDVDHLSGQSDSTMHRCHT